jgi:hypothetical protein
MEKECSLCQNEDVVVESVSRKKRPIKAAFFIFAADYRRE